MNTIICITTKSIWKHAKQSGWYERSTITSSLEEVGFIHATTPNQTMNIVQRFCDQEDVILLFINTAEVSSPIKFEAAKSGRAGLFPHIYGPLNISAVHKVIKLEKDKRGLFIAPAELSRLT